MKKTKIKWADYTFNPWIGCTKISAGCAHCYAEEWDKRFHEGQHWGKGVERKRTCEKNWETMHTLNKQIEALLNAEYVSDESDRISPRVFCGSLCDWLDPEVPTDWLLDLLDLIRQTPLIDWLLLTKRPGLWVERVMTVMRSIWLDKQRLEKYHDLLEWLHDWMGTEHCEMPGDPPAPPFNVWIGATIENQEHIGRLRELRLIPAQTRFISCEPLLSEINILPYLIPSLGVDGQECGDFHWVICGGESGRNARRMEADWARGLRDQCVELGIPFFFKQWGDFEGNKSGEGKSRRKNECVKLDGIEWSEFPDSRRNVEVEQ